MLYITVVVELTKPAYMMSTDRKRETRYFFLDVTVNVLGVSPASTATACVPALDLFSEKPPLGSGERLRRVELLFFYSCFRFSFVSFRRRWIYVWGNKPRSDSSDDKQLFSTIRTERC